MKPDICDWLRNYLSHGPVEVTEIRNAAKEAGYTRGELREAKLICCVKSTNNWSTEHPHADQRFWSLPEDEA